MMVYSRGSEDSLQNYLRQFKSARHLQNFSKCIDKNPFIVYNSKCSELGGILLNIKCDRWITILTIIIGSLIGMYMLFYSGQLASCGDDTINFHNDSSKMLLFAICFIWMVLYLTYKAYTFEQKINEIEVYANKNSVLQADVIELLNIVMQKSDSNTQDIQHFNKNTRELFLRLFLEKYGGRENEVDVGTGK